MRLATALHDARRAWLAGEPAAWSRYSACLAQLQALQNAHTTKPPPLRLPGRTGRPDRRARPGATA